MKLRLKAGERVFINGAVVRAEQRATLEFLNDVQFLLERQVMQAEDAITPLQQLYFLVQMLVLEPDRMASHLSAYRLALTQQVLKADRETLALLRDVDGLVVGERFHEAMKILRQGASVATQTKQERDVA